MSLQNATDGLEQAFSQTETRMDILSAKIDEAFIQSQDENPEQINLGRGPAELMQTLAGIRSEFNNIVKEVETFQKSQEEMFSTILQQIKSAQSVVDDLKDAAGTDVEK